MPVRKVATERYEMKNKFIGWGVAIGAGVGTAMGSATHQPGVWLPLGIGIGLAIGVALRDRKNNQAASS